jgi:hypothetical protein
VRACRGLVSGLVTGLVSGLVGICVRICNLYTCTHVMYFILYKRGMYYISVRTYGHSPRLLTEFDLS